MNSPIENTPEASSFDDESSQQKKGFFSAIGRFLTKSKRRSEKRLQPLHVRATAYSRETAEELLQRSREEDCISYEVFESLENVPNPVDAGIDHFFFGSSEPTPLVDSVISTFPSSEFESVWSAILNENGGKYGGFPATMRRGSVISPIGESEGSNMDLMEMVNQKKYDESEGEKQGQEKSPELCPNFQLHRTRSFAFNYDALVGDSEPVLDGSSGVPRVLLDQRQMSLSSLTTESVPSGSRTAEQPVSDVGLDPLDMALQELMSSEEEEISTSISSTLDENVPCDILSGSVSIDSTVSKTTPGPFEKPCTSDTFTGITPPPLVPCTKSEIFTYPNFVVRLKGPSFALPSAMEFRVSGNIDIRIGFGLAPTHFQVYSDWITLCPVSKDMNQTRYLSLCSVPFCTFIRVEVRPHSWFAKLKHFNFHGFMTRPTVPFIAQRSAYVQSLGRYVGRSTLPSLGFITNVALKQHLRRARFGARYLIPEKTRYMRCGEDDESCVPGLKSLIDDASRMLEEFQQADLEDDRAVLEGLVLQRAQAAWESRTVIMAGSVLNHDCTMPKEGGTGQSIRMITDTHTQSSPSWQYFIERVGTSDVISES